MKKSVADLINKQINKELFSAYLYLDFANYLTEKGMPGFAHWLRIQVMEERDHAMLFLDYMHYNGQKVELEAIEKPDVKVESAMDILKESLKHEEFITASINDIYEEALKVKDYRTKGFLDWFVKEQGEEEANFNALIDQLNLAGDNGLFMIDNQLASRQYAPPSLVIEE